MHSVISALITVFGIMLLGLITERRRALAPTMALCLNQFVYWISLPALIFNQMCAISSAENAVAYIWGTLAASILCYILAVLFFSRFGKKLDLEGTIRALSAVFPNAAFFGLPFIIMTFPGSETAVTAAMLGALLYTVVLLIADASLDILHTEKASRKGIARLLLGELVHNPMIIGAALGLMVSFSGANPPASILHIADMLGSTAAPCALFGMGMVLSAQISGSSGTWKNFSIRNVGIISIGKLLLQPVLSFLVLWAFGCPKIMIAVGTAISAMPTGSIVYILGERYQTCTTEASMTVIITTSLSLLSLPLVMYLLELAGMM